MDWKSIASSLPVIAGAGIMFVSILKSRELFRAVPLVPESTRPTVRRHLTVHRYLMKFFLLGYLFIATTLLVGSEEVSSLVVGAIFFFGAVFVLVGVQLQSRMLEEIQDTLQGLLPICSACKRVREDGGDPRDQDSWVQIESYLSQRTQAEFSHGMCPDCVAKLYPKPRSLVRSV